MLCFLGLFWVYTHMSMSTVYCLREPYAMCLNLGAPAWNMRWDIAYAMLSRVFFSKKHLRYLGSRLVFLSRGERD